MIADDTTQENAKGHNNRTDKGMFLDVDSSQFTLHYWLKHLGNITKAKEIREGLNMKTTLGYWFVSVSMRGSV